MKQARILLISGTMLVGSLGAAGAFAQDAPGEGAEAAEAAVTLYQAVAAAQDALGVTSAPSSAELYSGYGNPVWEVVIDNREVTVDADTGQVLGTEPLASGAGTGNAGTATVTLNRAVEAAQDALGVTSAPSSTELYRGYGFLVWEVVIGSQEVTVDASTAQVLEIEQIGPDDW